MRVWWDRYGFFGDVWGFILVLGMLAILAWVLLRCVVVK